MYQNSTTTNFIVIRIKQQQQYRQTIAHYSCDINCYYYIIIKEDTDWATEYLCMKGLKRK